MLDKVGKYEFLAEPFHCDFLMPQIFMQPIVVLA